MSECQTLPVDQVYVPIKRRRGLKSDLVREIAESILEIGQQTPIVVRRDGERFVLLDGLHRLEACKALGEEHVIAVLAPTQIEPPRVLSPHEAEIEILRQKTIRLRELRLAKEAAERPVPAASKKQNTTIRDRSHRLREPSRSKIATLAEWLADRKNDGSRF
jgi:uncharacterized ParB-like nuclease family protein